MENSLTKEGLSKASPSKLAVFTAINIYPLFTFDESARTSGKAIHHVDVLIEMEGL